MTSIYLPAPTVLEMPDGFRVHVHVPDEPAVNATWDLIRVARSTAPNGPWTTVADLTLAANDFEYNTLDTNGLITSWYSYTLRTTGGAESSRSEAVAAGGGQSVTLLDLIRRVAHRLGLFIQRPGETSFPSPSGTVTSASGSGVEVIDARYLNPLLDESFCARSWLRMASGARAGEERQIIRFDPSRGAFALANALTGAISAGDQFDILGLARFTDWQEWLNTARLHLWVPFDWPLVGVRQQTEYLLPSYVQSRAQIERVTRRSGNTVYQRGYSNDALPELMDLEDGRVLAYFPASLGENDRLIVRGRRNPPRLLDASAAWTLSEEQLEVATVAACVEACRALMTRFPSVSEDRATWSQRFRFFATMLERLAHARGSVLKRKRFPGTAMASLSGYHPLSWP